MLPLHSGFLLFLYGFCHNLALAGVRTYYYYYYYYYYHYHHHHYHHHKLQMGFYPVAVCSNARQGNTIQFNTIQQQITQNNTKLKTTLSTQHYKKSQEHLLYPSYNKSQLFLDLILVKNSTCIGQSYCPSSGVLILHTHQLVIVKLLVLTASEVGSF